MAKKDTIIIGYGNTLCSDDGVGYRAAELLTGRDEIKRYAEVIPCDQLTPEMAEKVCRARLVIFIDADSTLPEGEISCRNITPALEAHSNISHNFSPEQFLGFTSAFCEGAPEKAIMFSIGASSFDLGEELTPVVKAGLPSLLWQVIETVISMN
jgi:hydrogenase maturation protease